MLVLGWLIVKEDVMFVLLIKLDLVVFEDFLLDLFLYEKIFLFRGLDVFLELKNKKDYNNVIDFVESLIFRYNKLYFLLKSFLGVKNEYVKVICKLYLILKSFKF